MHVEFRTHNKKMVLIIGAMLALLATAALSQEHTEHRDFQYNSAVDPSTGRYNFAYDTGNDNDIAHSLHMQYQDADGIVRGRYGYTDPRGKLRMVEYEAGPGGFVARGDVGPDQFPHGQAPAPAADAPRQEGISSYNELPRGDFELDPAPIQMAGWDPATDSMNQPQPVEGGSLTSGDRTNLESEGLNGNDQYTTVNVTSENALELYGPELGFYSDRYPRIIYAPVDNNNPSDPESTTIPTTDTASLTQDGNGQTIDNIDVNPDDIRLAAGSPISRTSDDGSTRAPLVRRSGNVQQGQSSGSQYVRVPASYRNYYSRHYHDHDAEVRSRQTHDHDAEKRSRQTHDHDAEMRSRQTHDHDAEVRRHAHDHEAERLRYRARQTHDHDAEVRSRHAHDHDAEQRAYYRRLAAERSAYYRSLYRDNGYSYPRRIFYRDSHSMEPHEHFDNPVYRNYRDHQHSDRHLYARYRNYVYPATAKPRQLKYIPADKYHDKRYYWTYD